MAHDFRNLLIAIGSTLGVYPIAAVVPVARNAGSRIVILNAERTEMDDLFHGHAVARALAHRGVWLAYQDKQRELLAERQRSAIIQP